MYRVCSGSCIYIYNIKANKDGRKIIDCTKIGMNRFFLKLNCYNQAMAISRWKMMFETTAWNKGFA